MLARCALGFGIGGLVRVSIDMLPNGSVGQLLAVGVCGALTVGV